jgi:hypothetical protein
MRTGRPRTWLPTDLPRESNEERAALRRVLRATRADLADMDRLLDAAERLVSGGFGADQAAYSLSRRAIVSA